jgi:hypothetical protein
MGMLLWPHAPLEASNMSTAKPNRELTMLNLRDVYSSLSPEIDHDSSGRTAKPTHTPEEY